jgi:ubiquinone biosynthesis protein
MPSSRLLLIFWVAIRHGLDDLLFRLRPLRPFRPILWLWRWRNPPTRPRGERLRLTLEDLGPVFVKLGQMLSTRRDLLPEDIANELTRLQDQVPPFPGSVAITIIEKALGAPLTQIFQDFDPLPLASASIAQVHTARLHDGRDVVVKVVRPGIDKIIRRDIALMYAIADFLQSTWPEARRLRLREVVAEYEVTILDELDLIQEAANASQIRRNFLHSPHLYIPDIYWDYCRQQVMVMERIYGISLNNIQMMRELGVDLKKLSHRGVEIFFTQVFRHNFFHADMHPGNLFVSYEHPKDPQYIAVDFGIVGTLSPDDQRYLAENFVAFFNRDYRRVAELHIDSGWVPPSTRLDQLETAIRTVCEPIFQRPIKEIYFGHLLLRLFQIARRFDMQVQPQLVLLQKTLLNIEGLGRQLDPDLDLWQTAKPFLERWMSERMGPRAIFSGLRRNIPFIAEKVPELPMLMHQALTQMARQEDYFEQQRERLSAIQAALQQQKRQQGQFFLFFIIGLSLLLWALLSPPLPWWSIILALLLAWLVQRFNK